MQNNNKHTVSNTELDNLLKKAFLNLDITNPKNQNMMETISNQYLNPLPITFSFKNFILNKIVIIFILSIITLIFGTYFYSKSKAVKSVITKSEISEKLINNSIIKNKPTEIKNEKKETLSFVVNTNVIKVKDKAINKVLIYLAPENSSVQNIPTSLPFINSKSSLIVDTNYVFPKLTEKEIKENSKQKRKMIEALANHSIGKYGRIFPENVSFDDWTYMQNAEVTNLEYRTFIFDLLIQNRKDEFLISKPDQTQWTEIFKNELLNFIDFKEKYFSDKFYDDYPVVNISRVGAEMYCKWLTNVTNEFLVTKNKPFINDLRIPTISEWLSAAQSGSATADFPWGTNSVQNTSGCFLANFKIANFGEIKRDLKAKCPCEFKDAITSAGTIKGKTMLIAPVYSYNPNSNGMFCISGNVSEMVYEDSLGTKLKTAGTRGGSWFSDVECLKITSQNEFKNVIKPSPMIGFRPVITVRQTK